MARHRFDPTSFVLGVVLTAGACVYLVADLQDRSVDGRWVFPLLLIGLGLAAVAAGVSRAMRRDGAHADQADEAGEADEAAPVSPPASAPGATTAPPA